MNAQQMSARTLVQQYLTILKKRHQRLHEIGLRRICAEFNRAHPDQKIVWAIRMGDIAAAMTLLTIDIVVLSDILGDPVSELFRAVHGNNFHRTTLTPRRRNEFVRRVFNAAQQH